MKKYAIRFGANADRVLVSVANSGTRRAPAVKMGYYRPSEAPEGSSQIGFAWKKAAENFAALLNKIDPSKKVVVGSLSAKLPVVCHAERMIALMKKVA